MGNALLTDFFPLLLGTSLFQGLSHQELAQVLECFQPNVRSFAKGEIVQLAGYAVQQMGVVLTGSLEAVKGTPEGTSVAITRLEPGSLFGDVLSGSDTKSPVTIVACTGCTILLLPTQQLLNPRPEMHPYHLKLLQNWAKTLSEKYFALNRRVDLLILKTLRAKLCAYLLEQAQLAGADTFTIPFTRSGLADYLNCERTALCREISRMRAEGLIETYKNSFKLMNKAELLRQHQR